MATLPELEDALRNADAAGDTVAAQQLADEIVKVRGAAPSISAPPVEDTLGDQAISASASVLGAPVDLVNTIMSGVGLPMSDAPFMGSTQIEGMLQGLVGGRESRQIAADAPNVEQASAPLSQRVYSSFLNTPKARELYLTDLYGPEGQGWYKLADRFGNPTERIVVRGEKGKESLFNPPGIDFGDIAGMAGGVPDLVGALAGGAASIPAYAAGPVVGGVATAGTSAAGAQLVGETVGRLFPENRQAEPSLVSDVLPRAATEGLIDTIMGAGTGAVGGVATRGINAVRAPFAKSASDPLATEFRGAAERLQAQGYDIAPLPSESGAGGFVPRVEGFLEKLPGSAEKMRQYREGGDAAVSRFQRDVAGDVDPARVGREAVSEIETQKKNLTIDRETSLGVADQLIDQNQRALTARQGPEMGAEAAGQQLRGGLDRARQDFRAEAGRLYDAARAAPGGSDPIVDMAVVQEQVKGIRASLPPTAEGAPSQQFAPQGLTRLLSGVDEIAGNMTLDQARQMRSIVSDAIDDKTILPGVPERNLVQLREALSSAIDGSVEKAGSPELREALTTANSYYRENVNKFSRKGVAETYREPTQPGFVEDNQLVSRLLSGAGKPGVIRDIKRTIGEDTPAWAAARRQAVEQILDTGRDQTRFGKRVVNADGLVARLNSLDDEAVRELFGVSDAQQLRNLAADVSNRTKYLDVDAFSQNGTPNVIGQLRAAAVAEEQIAREYRDGVVGPFLCGENGATAKMRSEELVPWLYRQAHPQEIKQVLAKLPAQQRADVERGAVADIIENAISKGAGDISAVRRLVTGEAAPADSKGIAEVLGVHKDTAGRQQAARIDALLSPQSKQALRDLAVVTARRQERDATTQAIGGLAAGAAVTNIITKPSSAFKAGLIARGLAELITNPKVRAYLTNTKQSRPGPEATAATIAVAPSVYDVIGGMAAENEDVQAAMDWLREGSSQIGTEGERLTRPPEGYKSWQEYFSTSEQRKSTAR